MDLSLMAKTFRCRNQGCPADSDITRFFKQPMRKGQRMMFPVLLGEKGELIALHDFHLLFKFV
jgi:hypothetical protein